MACGLLIIRLWKYPNGSLFPTSFAQLRNEFAEIYGGGSGGKRRKKRNGSVASSASSAGRRRRARAGSAGGAYQRLLALLGSALGADGEGGERDEATIAAVAAAAKAELEEEELELRRREGRRRRNRRRGARDGTIGSRSRRSNDASEGGLRRRRGRSSGEMDEEGPRMVSPDSASPVSPSSTGENGTRRAGAVRRRRNGSPMPPPSSGGVDDDGHARRPRRQLQLDVSQRGTSRRHVGTTPSSSNLTTRQNQASSNRVLTSSSYGTETSPRTAMLLAPPASATSPLPPGVEDGNVSPLEIQSPDGQIFGEEMGEGIPFKDEVEEEERASVTPSSARNRVSWAVDLDGGIMREDRGVGSPDGYEASPTILVGEPTINESPNATSYPLSPLPDTLQSPFIVTTPTSATTPHFDITGVISPTPDNFSPHVIDHEEPITTDDVLDLSYVADVAGDDDDVHEAGDDQEGWEDESSGDEEESDLSGSATGSGESGEEGEEEDYDDCDDDDDDDDDDGEESSAGYAEESKNLLNLLYSIAEDQARKDGYVHRSITCNHCGVSPVRGFRFKCAHCVDFDLCETCEAADVHPRTHVVLKIRIPIPPHANPRRSLVPLFYPGKAIEEGDLLSVEFRELGVGSHFDVVELQAFYEQFRSLATVEESANGPAGITREVFEQSLGPLGLEKNLITERIFEFFDQDKDKLISFPELVSGLSILCKGSLDERIKYAFQGYDIDGDGLISRDELHRMFKAYFYLSMELVRDFVRTMEAGMMETFDDEASKPVSAAFSAPIEGSGGPNDDDDLIKEDPGQSSSSSSYVNRRRGKRPASAHESDGGPLLLGASYTNASSVTSPGILARGTRALQEHQLRRRSTNSLSHSYRHQGGGDMPPSPIAAVSPGFDEFGMFGVSGVDYAEAEQWPIVEAMSQDAIEEMVEKTFLAANAESHEFITLEEFRRAVEADNSYLQCVQPAEPPSQQQRIAPIFTKKSIQPSPIELPGRINEVEGSMDTVELASTILSRDEPVSKVSPSQETESSTLRPSRSAKSAAVAGIKLSMDILTKSLNPQAEFPESVEETKESKRKYPVPEAPPSDATLEAPNRLDTQPIHPFFQKRGAVKAPYDEAPVEDFGEGKTEADVVLTEDGGEKKKNKRSVKARKYDVPFVEDGDAATKRRKQVSKQPKECMEVQGIGDVHMDVSTKAGRKRKLKDNVEKEADFVSETLETGEGFKLEVMERVYSQTPCFSNTSDEFQALDLAPTAASLSKEGEGKGKEKERKGGGKSDDLEILESPFDAFQPAIKRRGLRPRRVQDNSVVQVGEEDDLIGVDKGYTLTDDFQPLSATKKQLAQKQATNEIFPLFKKTSKQPASEDMTAGEAEEILHKLEATPIGKNQALQSVKPSILDQQRDDPAYIKTANPFFLTAHQRRLRTKYLNEDRVRECVRDATRLHAAVGDENRVVNAFFQRRPGAVAFAHNLTPCSSRSTEFGTDSLVFPNKWNAHVPRPSYPYASADSPRLPFALRSLPQASDSSRASKPVWKIPTVDPTSSSHATAQSAPVSVLSLAKEPGHNFSSVKISASALRELLENLYGDTLSADSCTLLVNQLFVASLERSDSQINESARGDAWTERYRPQRSIHILGSENAFAALSVKEWLQIWSGKKDAVSSTGNSGEDPIEPAATGTNETCRRSSRHNRKRRRRNAYDSDSSADYTPSEASEPCEEFLDDSDFVVEDEPKAKRTKRARKTPKTGAALHLRLIGPPGSGRTAAVRAAAFECGYHIVEVNAGQRRSGKDITIALEEATQSHGLVAAASTGPCAAPSLATGEVAKKKVDIWKSMWSRAKVKSDLETKEDEELKAALEASLKDIDIEALGMPVSQSGKLEKKYIEKPDKDRKRRSSRRGRGKRAAFESGVELAEEAEKKAESEKAIELDTIDIETVDELKGLLMQNPIPPKKSFQVPIDQEAGTEMLELNEEFGYSDVENAPQRKARKRSQRRSYTLDDADTPITQNLSTATPIYKPYPGAVEPLPPDRQIFQTASRLSELSTKPSLILIEEADVLFRQDKGFWGTVLSLIEGSKRPIVLTCNDDPLIEQNPHIPTSTLLSSLQRSTMPLHFSRPLQREARCYIHLLLLCEGVWIDPDDVAALCKKTRVDIRNSILAAQTWAGSRIHGDDPCGRCFRIVAKNERQSCEEDFELSFRIVSRSEATNAVNENECGFKNDNVCVNEAPDASVEFLDAFANFATDLARLDRDFAVNQLAILQLEDPDVYPQRDEEDPSSDDFPTIFSHTITKPLSSNHESARTAILGLLANDGGVRSFADKILRVHAIRKLRAIAHASKNDAETYGSVDEAIRRASSDGFDIENGITDNPGYKRRAALIAPELVSALWPFGRPTSYYNEVLPLVVSMCRDDVNAKDAAKLSRDVNGSGKPLESDASLVKSHSSIDTIEVRDQSGMSNHHFSCENGPIMDFADGVDLAHSARTLQEGEVTQQIAACKTSLLLDVDEIATCDPSDNDFEETPFSAPSRRSSNRLRGLRNRGTRGFGLEEEDRYLRKEKKKIKPSFAMKLS
ncbi:hypothetical protein HDU67_006493 [Dinochytrium kinnereticum]|nr:hypothetical protein HDU67_006493 [Dinochytrium kinnereticum]